MLYEAVIRVYGYDKANIDLGKVENDIITGSTDNKLPWPEKIEWEGLIRGGVHVLEGRVAIQVRSKDISLSYDSDHIAYMVIKTVLKGAPEGAKASVKLVMVNRIPLRKVVGQNGKGDETPHIV